jgi:hypothetical protein
MWRIWYAYHWQSKRYIKLGICWNCRWMLSSNLCSYSCLYDDIFKTNIVQLTLTRGSVGWAYHIVLRKLYTEPSIGASCQISINLAKWFYTEYFLIGQSQTRTAYGSHISNKISTKYRYFVQVLPHIILTKQQFIVPSLRSEEYIQSDARISHGDHMFVQSGCNKENV